MTSMVGKELSEKLRKISLDLYKVASDYALTKNIIIADTKFEFGIVNDEIILIDEVLTPDSSRFWDVDGVNMWTITSLGNLKIVLTNK